MRLAYMVVATIPMILLVLKKINTETKDGNSISSFLNNEIAGYPQQNLFTFDELSIDSRFESGNLMAANKVNSGEYRLWIAPDCYQTEYETTNRVWFYFKVSQVDLQGQEDRNISFTIANMGKLEHKNFKEGMVPVYSSTHNNYEWQYLPTPVTNVLVINETTIEVTFEYTFTTVDSEHGVYFAFTFPYTYTDCQNFLNSLESSYKQHPSIFFQRSLLVNSLASRRVDLLIITSVDERTKNFSPGTLSKPIISFEESKTDEEILSQARLQIETLLKFENKKFILLSARIHAAESPGSFMLQGFINKLLKQDDPVSQELLKNFVFVIIPMLNPDAVYQGHYRMDTKGRDLNRTYKKVLEELREYPGPLGVLEVAKVLNKGNRLCAYIDFHAHSNKNSGFILGNYNEDKKIMDEMKVFARVMDVYSKNFNYNSCIFGSIQDLQDNSKVGVGSRTIREETGIVYSYTLESGYHRTTKDPDRYDVNKNIWGDLKKRVARRMEVTDFEEIGESVRHALLEMLGSHPNSKLQETWYKDVEGIRREMCEEFGS